MDLLEQLAAELGLRPIDVQAGRLLARLGGPDCPELAAAAALTSWAGGQGHTCLPLSQLSTQLRQGTGGRLDSDPARLRRILLATGAVWQGVLLIAYGVFVISMVDNVLRPVLVGKDTKMPDYVVLISTLGGIQAFGLNGFILGPVIAAMFIAVWDIFASSRHTAAHDREAA